MDISLAPEILFYVGPLPMSNTLLWTLIVTWGVMGFFVLLASRLKAVPGTAQNLAEALIEGAYDFVRRVTGNEQRALRIFPLVFTLFIFILTANLITFIPGSAISIQSAGGALPLFRAVMSDYGMVLIMTLISVITTQVVAVAMLGPLGYIGKFINLKGIAAFFRLAAKGEFKLGVLAQGLLDFFLGLMDIIGESAKVVSLSFRLFGNLFAGEVLTAVMLFLAPFIAPLPFMFLGLLTAVVQAFVFSVLTLIFITAAAEAS